MEQTTIASEDQENLIGKVGAVVIILIITSGSTGNLCVLVTICREPTLRQLQHYVLVASLATSDLLFNLLIMPFYVDTWWYNSNRHSQNTCFFYNYVGTVLLQLSGTIIVFIALNRYLLITHIRLFKKFENFKATAVQIILAIILSIATLSQAFTEPDEKLVFQEKIARCNFHRIRARPVIYAVFTYCVILPLVLMSTFYILIVIKLKKSRKIIQQSKKRLSTDLEMETIYAIAHGLPTTDSLHAERSRHPSNDKQIFDYQVAADILGTGPPDLTPIVKYHDTRGFRELVEQQSHSQQQESRNSSPTFSRQQSGQNREVELDKRRRTTLDKQKPPNVKAFLPIVAIFAAYLVTYIPFTVINMVDSDYRLAREYYMISSLFFWASSCLNPWIYGLMNSELNTALKRLILQVLTKLRCCQRV